ncbi:MAG: hypothetical protein JWM28_58 [Chitinophagaceae bacterium]|nr:hypothetical protein [Chitinophagaceae bacterium]
MKIKLLSLSALAFSLTLLFTACKKDHSAASNNNDYSTELSAQSDDQAQVSAEVDAVADDANAAVSSESSMSGRVLADICDATVEADTTGDIKTLTITYNGTNCHGNRKRSGVVVLSMPKAIHWKDAGATLTVSIQNLKITRLRDNKSITINGTKTITNVTGGLLKDLASHGTIVHTINSDGIAITFDNNTQRNWKIAMQRTFTYNNGIVITITGTHTEGTDTGIAVWGTNRLGNAFTCFISSPLVVRQDCDFRVVSGEIIHVRSALTATTTFGLDASGLPTSCPGTGTYYFKLVWVGANGNSHTIIWPY